MTDSKISWTTKTWNPTTGCDQVSPGCDNCYALTLAKRLKRMGNPRYLNDGDPKTSGPGFALTVHPDKLQEPLRWKRSATVFVNSMSDLFHDDVPDAFIAAVWRVMIEAGTIYSLKPYEARRGHTFQVLTKRPRRMLHFVRDLWADLDKRLDLLFEAEERWPTRAGETEGWDYEADSLPDVAPNVWLGTSVENQKWANLRIPLLLETPAAVRFLSCEPLLGPVDLDPFLDGGYLSPWKDELLHWIIVGGESGPNHRPLDLDWARGIRDQATAAGVPFFYKQGSGPRSEMFKLLDGLIWDEMPGDRRPVQTVADAQGRL